MSLTLVEDFFPGTSSLLRERAPHFWHVAVSLLNGTCSTPYIDFKIFSDSHTRLKWPALVPLCIGGITLGVLCSFKLFRKALSGPSPPAGAFSWAYAFLWYALMCMAGLLYHCISPLYMFRMMDIVSTSCSSISISIALLSHVSWWKDNERNGRRRLHALFLLVALLARFGHPLIQEQLYLLPVVLSGLFMVVLLYGCKDLKHGDVLVLGRLNVRVLQDSKKWLVLCIACALGGFGMAGFDKLTCLILGPHFLAVISVFLGCDLAFLFMYKFASALLDSQQRERSSKYE